MILIQVLCIVPTGDKENQSKPSQTCLDCRLRAGRPECAVWLVLSAVYTDILTCNFTLTTSSCHFQNYKANQREMWNMKKILVPCWTNLKAKVSNKLLDHVHPSTCILSAGFDQKLMENYVQNTHNLHAILSMLCSRPLRVARPNWILSRMRWIQAHSH